MQGLALLREMLSRAQKPDAAAKGQLPPHELRFILEFPDSSRIASSRNELERLLGSDAFLLEPLGTSRVLEQFAVLRFPDLERTLANREMFGIGYDLVDTLGLNSAEPELGSDAFADPRPPLHGDMVESAAVAGLCWVDSAPPEDKQWALQNIGAVNAWSLSKGAGIVVAQPDTGIATHDELPDSSIALESAADILDGDSDPTDPLDSHAANPGHGTGTASVLVSPESGAITGAAPQARVAPIRCITDVKVFNTGPVAAAIAHAVQAGCHVISMSLGGLPGRAMRRAVQAAIDNDMIVIAAAGNCVRIVVWPAKYSEVIAVGGSNSNDQVWKGSSRGSAVDICAPAELVWRAERDQTTDPTSAIGPGQGTSFATALVAGCAALWLSRHGREQVVQEARTRGTSVQALFRSALQATARCPEGWDSDDLGAGIVDAFSLLSLQLKDIPGQTEGTAVAESVAQQVLDAVPSGAGFDAYRYELELAAIALEQAKLGGDVNSLSSEAKVAQTRPSLQLSAAAAASNSPQIQRFAERASSSVSRPLVLATQKLDPRRLRLAIPRSAGLESANGTVDERVARDYLANAGRSVQMQKAEAVLGSNLNLSQDSRNKALDQIDEAIRAIGQGDSHLTMGAQVGFEALVRLTGRPALRVRNGTIDLNDPRAADWHDELFLLLQQPDFLRRALSAGRIDLDGVHVGSGSVVGPGLVLTNRHVLQALAAPVPRRENPDRWVLTGDGATIDFSEEPSSLTGATRFRITGVVGAGPSNIDFDSLDFSDLDAALLEVETTNSDGKALPEPIGLARKPTRVDRGTHVIVVGYPARPGSLPVLNGGVDVEVAKRLNELFGLDYSHKYIAPGEIDLSTGGLVGDTSAWTFSHDATTLGGNSGSCVFGLADPLGVVGLHFGGGWRRANYAHAVGAIARNNNFLTDSRIQWLD